MKIFQMLCLAFTLSSLVFVACVDERTYTNGENASLNIRMTDAPGDYKSLNLAVVQVEAYLEGEGWIELNANAQTFDILELNNGKEISLAARQNMKIGTYSKIKLTFDDSSKLLLGLHGDIGVGPIEAGANAEVELEWLGNHEVIVEIDHTLRANSSDSLLLDFNVAESVKESAGKYVIRPTINFVKDEKTDVEGRVKGQAHAAILLMNESDTFSTYVDASGEFLLRGMHEGEYDLLVQPDRERIYQQGADAHKIEGVVIAKGEIKNMGTIQW